jgi:formylglycine-generating enzyme required for sulfatase activity
MFATIHLRVFSLAKIGETVTFGEMSMKTTKSVGIVLLAVVVFAAVGGCKSKESAEQGKTDAGPKAFKNEVYRALGGSEVVTIISPTELELRKGGDNFVCEYTRQDDGIRVVMTILGTKQAEYLSTVAEGLRHNGLLLYDVQHYQSAQADSLASMKRVLIPSGKFMMGSPKDEKDREDSEGPQREVTISKPFYMGVYAVTQEQYEQVMGKNPSNFKGAENPVENVSWNDAAEFCKKLSQKTGTSVRLPTEAEWEYACRAGSKTRFSYGDDNDYANLGDYAWYGQNSDNKTHPVGQKKPNAFGLYDMHGNVWEWCSDWYGAYEDKAQTDPTGPASGSARVLRGGGWIYDPQVCRSAYRARGDPDNRGSVFGFRVVLDLK